MSDNEILDKIMELEHKINGILVLTGNKDNITVLLLRQQIKHLTLKLDAC